MKKWSYILLVITLLLTGCSTGPQTIGSNPTVEDIFVPPVTTAPTVPTVPGVTQPTDPILPTRPSGDMGGMGFGIEGDFLEDDVGHYRLYEGGEICMPFMLQASGQAMVSCVKDGIGILLFLDGQPQPYRVGEDGELGYFHILYPDYDTAFATGNKSQQVIYDLYFTPVAGMEGETVELWASTIVCPNWQKSDPMVGFKYTFGAMQVGTRIKMAATPQNVEKPKNAEYLKSVDITHVNASFAEMGTWTDAELIEKYETCIYINGINPKAERTSTIYGISADEEVELRFEVWGTPYVRYGLMFYVNNLPVSAQQEIQFDMKNGMKTVITAKIQISDFDGECPIYAVLIPRNARSTKILTWAFIDLGNTYFLVDDPKP